MATHEDVPGRLSNMLDCLGYSRQMINYRKDAFRESDKTRATKVRSVGTIKTVGSKGEGIVRYFESDTDVLNIPSRIVCLEECISETAEDGRDLTAIFRVKYSPACPGYCALLLKFYRARISVVSEALCPFADGFYLSSKKYKEFSLSTYKQMVTSESSLSGPAISATLPFTRDNDSVMSLRLICPNILQKFVTRKRKTDWPQLEVRQMISKMEANLTPTGCKGDRMEAFQWRLCFNEIEIILVESLNDTQIKVLKLLKMIKSDILTPNEIQITSYMLKNIVFWLAETYSPTAFHTDTLFFWVIKALRLLKRSISIYALPYYLIPERNLLAEKIDDRARESLTSRLDSVIHMGPQILMHLRKVQFVLDLTPSELAEVRDKRDEYEMLFLSVCNLLIGDSDNGVSDMLKRMHYIADVRNGWPEPIQNKIFAGLGDMEWFLLR